MFLLPSICAAVPGALDKYHKPLARVLTNYVRQEIHFNGRQDYTRTVVKYRLLQKYGAWKTYLDDLASSVPKSRITKEQDNNQKAFWINCYNAIVLDNVIANYPIRTPALPPYPLDSVQSVPDFWIRPHSVAQTTVTLTQVEERLMDMDDLRVLFAINQGAIDSPPLAAKPFDASTVDQMLDDTMDNYLADPVNYLLNRETNQLRLSEYFKLHVAQFLSANSTIPPPLMAYPEDQRAILAFILLHVRQQDQDYILEKQPTVIYNPFNWNLNEVL